MSGLHIPNTRKIQDYAYESAIQSTASRYLGTRIDYRTGISVVTARKIALIFDCDDEYAEVGIALLLDDGNSPWTRVAMTADGSAVPAILRPEFEAAVPEHQQTTHALTPTAAGRSIKRQRDYIASLNRNGRELPPWEVLANPAPIDLTVPTGIHAKTDRYPGYFMEQSSQD